MKMRKAIIAGTAVVAAAVLVAIGVFVGSDLTKSRSRQAQSPTPAQPAQPGFGLPAGKEVRVSGLVPKAFQDPGAPQPFMTVKAEELVATPATGESERGTYVCVKVTAKAEADSIILPEFYLLAGTAHLNPVPIAQPGWTPLFLSDPTAANTIMLNKGETREGWVTFDAPKLPEYELVLLDPSTAEKRASWKLKPTAAPTTTTTAPKNEVKIGTTQDYKDADGYHIRFTVFRYRELGESPYRPTRRSVAVEVRATVLAAPPPDELGFGGAPRLTWMAWTLQDAAGHTYEAEASGDEDFALYPEDKATPVGTSRRGWIPFQLPRNAKPTTIEYTPEDANRSLKWPIKK
jgi:hypothetical protein